MTTPHYTSRSPASGVRAIWPFRQLLLSLVARELTVKYQRSVLGLLWTLLNPILMVLVFIVVFSGIMRVGIESFWAFLISGFFAWGFTADAVVRSTVILRGQAGLRRTVAFPSEILVLDQLFSKLIEYLIELTLVLVVLCVFHHDGVPAPLILTPYLVLLQVLLTAGLMFPLSVFTVLYHDIEHALPALIRMLFYFTPIFYSVEMLPDSVRPFMYLNPFVGLLRLYHVVLYEGAWPSWTLLGAVTAVAVVVFLIGYSIFQRLKDVCVELA
jgi:homopolymeric O-antigen transport system permease protein